MTRSSRSQMLFKIGALKNFAIFIGKHLYCSLFLKGIKNCNSIKKDFNTSVSPLNILKFLRTAF